ncbi:MAG: ABC transporter permease subunit [Thermotaleaceae bacterium]
MKRNLYAYKPYFLLLPVLIVLGFIFIGGLVNALLQSLGYFPLIGMRKLTFDYYKEVLKNKDFIHGFCFSLCISFFSSAVAVGMGVYLSYILVSRRKKDKLVKLLYKLPIIVPHSAAVLLMLMLLSDSGIVARVLFHLNWIDSQSSLMSMVFDRRGVGIIISYIWKEIPFIAMVVYTVMSKVNDGLTEAAYNLGASSKQVFFYVTLPLLMPTISSSFIIIFAFSFGAFEVPYLIGPTFPKALPVMAYIHYIDPNLAMRPYAMVILMTITLISILLILLYSRFMKKVSLYDR